MDNHKDNVNNQIYDCESASTNDYYNLPLASLTFGKDSGKQLFQMTKEHLDEQIEQMGIKQNGKEIFYFIFNIILVCGIFGTNSSLYR